MAKIPGRSLVRTSGRLNVARPYIQIPYKLIRSQDFLSLSPYAVKVYMVLLRNWYTRDPDEPVVISYRKLCEAVGTGTKQICNALKELTVSGYVYKQQGYKCCNRYYIEQKRFTGEY